MKTVNSILLIDDDDDFNHLHKRLFSKMKLAGNIDVATNGQQALDFLISKGSSEGGYPDLIFLDIDMPVMDGWNFLFEYEMLRKVFSKAVLVMFTSNDDDLVREKALSIGFVDAFLIKPLTEQNVRQVLNKYFSDTPLVGTD